MVGSMLDSFGMMLLVGEFVVWWLVLDSPWRGMIAGYTVLVSVFISALSGGYVPDKGTPQSSLSTGLWDLCVVVGRLLGEFVVGSMLDSFVANARRRRRHCCRHDKQARANKLTSTRAAAIVVVVAVTTSKRALSLLPSQ